ncbi:hypothetical protein HIMB11_01121 [Rhodobacteraceae bacterium HIMB11]|nr:hypothetical protein HIMB11_01121 [Rhodobacteraceae bacterium HIMB11]
MGFAKVAYGLNESDPNNPATDWIMDVSNASIAFRGGGRMLAMRAAIMDLPDPGGPTKNT